MQKDSGDRNRTSPFAFTGNRFEFRAVGSSQNPSRSCMAINSIVADSLSYIADEITKAGGGAAAAEKVSFIIIVLLDFVRSCDCKFYFHICFLQVARDVIKAHQRICFEGDGYSAEVPFDHYLFPIIIFLFFYCK